MKPWERTTVTKIKGVTKKLRRGTKGWYYWRGDHKVYVDPSTFKPKKNNPRQ